MWGLACFNNWLFGMDFVCKTWGNCVFCHTRLRAFLLRTLQLLGCVQVFSLAFCMQTSFSLNDMPSGIPYDVVVCAFSDHCTIYTTSTPPCASVVWLYSPLYMAGTECPPRPDFHDPPLRLCYRIVAIPSRPSKARHPDSRLSIHIFTKPRTSHISTPFPRPGDIRVKSHEMVINRIFLRSRRFLNHKCPKSPCQQRLLNSPINKEVCRRMHMDMGGRGLKAYGFIHASSQALLQCYAPLCGIT